MDTFDTILKRPLTIKEIGLTGDDAVYHVGVSHLADVDLRIQH